MGPSIKYVRKKTLSLLAVRKMYGKKFGNAWRIRFWLTLSLPCGVSNLWMIPYIQLSVIVIVPSKQSKYGLSVHPIKIMANCQY